MVRVICVIALVSYLLAPLALSAADNPARVYVYASWNSMHRSSVSVSCDGVIVAKLKRGRFFVLDLPAGKHVLDVENGGLPALIDAKPKDEIFVRLEQYVSGAAPGLSVKPSRLVLGEIVNLVYIEPRDVSSGLVRREDPNLQWRPELKKRTQTE